MTDTTLTVIAILSVMAILIGFLVFMFWLEFFNRDLLLKITVLGIIECMFAINLAKEIVVHFYHGEIVLAIIGLIVLLCTLYAFYFLIVVEYNKLTAYFINKLIPERWISFFWVLIKSEDTDKRDEEK
ncbi:hypothetical protein [Marininema halotolerans]|uniref:Uncharacterized protein n=1 Tax=Marininema halotolerans TaxID=1155944 RepID=A0A1I6SHD0_9BACL|nr:hypothetical protein [Marininema halotolerans]SFS76280.1 hypothetical protein SAMN05444972_10787 [Marininema halotolerans]